MIAWEVRLHDQILDIVWFNKSMCMEEVYNSLVDHDGYPEDISLRTV